WKRGRQRLTGLVDVLVIEAVADDQDEIVTGFRRRSGSARRHVLARIQRQVCDQRRGGRPRRKARKKTLAGGSGGVKQRVAGTGQEVRRALGTRWRRIHDVPRKGVQNQIRVEQREPVEVDHLPDVPRLRRSQRNRERPLRWRRMDRPPRVLLLDVVKSGALM